MIITDNAKKYYEKMFGTELSFLETDPEFAELF